MSNNIKPKLKIFGRLGRKNIPKDEEVVAENSTTEEVKMPDAVRDENIIDDNDSLSSNTLDENKDKVLDAFVEQEIPSELDTEMNTSMKDVFIPEETPIPIDDSESKKPAKPVIPPTYENKVPQNSGGNINFEIDPNMPYFFVFGPPSSGKTAMLSGLVYYFKTLAQGQITVLNSSDRENHKRGQRLLHEMKTKVREGLFLPGTRVIQIDEVVFPNEIQLEFIPDDTKRPTMPFCLVDMSGEDLKNVNFGEGGMTGGDLDPKINSYLEHPECNLVFILAIDPDDINFGESLIDRFLDHVESLGHAEVPVIFTVNKWDKIRADYENVEEFFKINLPLLERRRKDLRRETAILDFSIGKVEKSEIHKEGIYNYDPKDSMRLANWMYEVATGYKMNQIMNDSNLTKILKKIKKAFKNG